MISSSHKSLSETHDEKTLGHLVAGALSGSWRQSSVRPYLSEAKLSPIMPLLDSSGCAALGWWRIRNSKAAESAIGTQLHDGYRHLRLGAGVHEREIKHLLSLLRAVDIEPVLVKGWAIARHYPDRALRPYGDIDLCVRPDQFEQAEAALKCLKSIRGHYVDLHNGFAKLEGAPQPYGGHKQFRVQASACRRWDELFDRSQLVDIGDEKIRVLSAEDHLRVLCLHLLRSGAWRPLWLCDIAVALESRGPDFNWEQCLGPDRRLADWVACTVGLAHRLLRVDISDTPVAERARNLPRWLVPAVLRQWGRCRNPDGAGMAMPALVRSLTEPKELFNQIYARWDQPVHATAQLGGNFSDRLRWPYQIGELILRSPEVPRQLSMMLREQMNLLRQREPAPRLDSDSCFLTSDL